MSLKEDALTIMYGDEKSAAGLRPSSSSDRDVIVARLWFASDKRAVKATRCSGDVWDICPQGTSTKRGPNSAALLRENGLLELEIDLDLKKFTH